MDDPPALIRPTPGPVQAGFRYARATPFAAGQRRGMTFAAHPGKAVAAPCRGRVTFAGRTPRGGAVSLRCGRWAVTVLGVEATVGAGKPVGAGRALGRATDAVVALSLRSAADRWGYVDPRPWIDATRPAAPLGPAPRAPSAPRSVPVPAPRPAPTPRAVPVPRPVPIPRPAPVLHPAFEPSTRRQATVPRVVVADRPRGALPWLAAAGLGLAALGLPTLRRRHRSARRAPGTGGGLYLPSVDR